MGNLSAVFFLPFPNPFFECFPADLLAGCALTEQHFFHLQLGCNPGMIGPGDPQGGFSFHPVIADHDILRADKQGMPQMQTAGHIGRRDDDHKRFNVGVMTRQVGIIGRLKIAFAFPVLINLGLIIFKLIRLGQLGHLLPLLQKGQSPVINKKTSAF